MKHIITHISLIIATSLSFLAAKAAPTVMTVANHLNDSTIVFPESVETDTQKMMSNWYLRTYTALDRDVESRPDANVSDEEMIRRLSTMPTIIEMPYNSVVRAYIDMYTSRKRSLVESMLGMSLYYMPIFEQALEREGVPNELKYLPIVESALNPDAVSRAGATGLWQFMLPTARGLGLEVNTLVDERRDPIRSSQMAAAYLKQLHDIYNDWSLAIAAYNCGPGNINKALRRCPGDDQKDFWAIYPYLPQETRGYLPCFIAVNYVMNYYDKHNISPALAKRPILTDSVHVNKRIYFQQIADVMQVPMEELQALNPQYRKQFIPGDIRSYSLVLPSNQIPSFIMSEDAIVAHDADKYARRLTVEPATIGSARAGVVDGQEGLWVTVQDVQYHKVRKNENLNSIARKYGISVKELKRSNGNIKKARRGKTLKIVTSRQEFRPNPVQPDTASVVNEEQQLHADSLQTSVTETIAQLSQGELEAATTEELTPQQTLELEQEISDADAQAAGRKVTATFTRARITNNNAAQADIATTAEVDSTKTAPTKKKTDAAKSKNTGAKTHTVRKGESLFAIAQKHGTTVKKLQKLNGLKGNKIKPGDKLKIK